MKNIKKLIMIVFASLSLQLSIPVHAAGSDYEDSPLSAIYDLIEDRKYGNAISELQKLDKKDADVMNLLGFSHRKLKKYDEALNYYQQALAIKPKHKGANEYLGELYLETDQLDKAKERLAVLDDACFFGCNEYDTLEKAIKQYEKQ